MAEIQLATLAVLELVTRDNSGLHSGCSGNKRRQVLEPVRERFRPAGLAVAQGRTVAQPYEILREGLEKSDGLLIIAVILDYECLEHLRSSSLEILHRQAFEHLRADVCELWLTDGSEHVLVAGDVDSGLASD